MWRAWRMTTRRDPWVNLLRTTVAVFSAGVGGAEQSTRMLATVASADELARMEIALSDGRRVRLDQLATISDTVAEQRSLALFSEQFSPYQFRQARILEFPSYANFAQSFANTIPYSENIGFLMPGRSNPATILIFGTLLGTLATFAEPAIGVLQTAGVSVSAEHAGLLKALLGPWSGALVLAVADRKSVV